MPNHRGGVCLLFITVWLDMPPPIQAQRRLPRDAAAATHG